MPGEAQDADGEVVPGRPVGGSLHLRQRPGSPGPAGGGHDAAASRRVSFGRAFPGRGRRDDDRCRRAIVASRWMPIGLASFVEPHPGINVDWVVLGAGLVIAPLLVLAGAAATAASALTASRRHPGRRRSAVAGAASRAGLAAPVVIGARFALEPGRGRAAVPVRPALVGAVTGVLGVLAAFTFAAGVSDAAGNPARFGQTWQLATFLGLNGQDLGPASQVLRAVAADRDVTGVDDARIAGAQSGQFSIESYTYAPVAGKRPSVVLTAGRLPTARERDNAGPDNRSPVARGDGLHDPARRRRDAAGSEGNGHRLRPRRDRTTTTPTGPGSHPPDTTGYSRARTTPSSSTPPPWRCGPALTCKQSRAGWTPQQLPSRAARISPLRPRASRRTSSRSRTWHPAAGAWRLPGPARRQRDRARLVHRREPPPPRAGGAASARDDPAADADSGRHPGERARRDRAGVRGAARSRARPRHLARGRRLHAAGLSPAAGPVGASADRPRLRCWPRTRWRPGRNGVPRGYAPHRRCAPSDAELAGCELGPVRSCPRGRSRPPARRSPRSRTASCTGRAALGSSLTPAPPWLMGTFRGSLTVSSGSQLASTLAGRAGSCLTGGAGRVLAWRVNGTTGQAPRNADPAERQLPSARPGSGCVLPRRSCTRRAWCFLAVGDRQPTS